MFPDLKIADAQAVRMLQNVLSGMPNLTPVLNLNCQARKTGGQTTCLSLGERVTLLAQQAQVHNNANTHAHNGCHRSATNHDLFAEGQEHETNVHKFDGDEDVEDVLDNVCEVNMTSQHNQSDGRHVPNKFTGSSFLFLHWSQSDCGCRSSAPCGTPLKKNVGLTNDSSSPSNRPQKGRQRQCFKTKFPTLMFHQQSRCNFAKMRNL